MYYQIKIKICLPSNEDVCYQRCVLLTDALLQIVELAPVIFLERKEQTLAVSELGLCANKERLYYLFTLFRYFPFSLSVCI